LLVLEEGGREGGCGNPNMLQYFNTILYNIERGISSFLGIVNHYAPTPH
jgi:anti-sigma regulatory factor (Ser/Thr protein kinase)